MEQSSKVKLESTNTLAMRQLWEAEGSINTDAQCFKTWPPPAQGRLTPGWVPAITKGQFEMAGVEPGSSMQTDGQNRGGFFQKPGETAFQGLTLGGAPSTPCT